MKDIINWHELSRRLSGNGQNIRPNSYTFPIAFYFAQEVERVCKCGMPSNDCCCSDLMQR